MFVKREFNVWRKIFPFDFCSFLRKRRILGVLRQTQRMKMPLAVTVAALITRKRPLQDHPCLLN